MKKFALALAVCATLVGNVGHAQGTTKKMGSSAQSGGTYSEDTVAWGVGVGAVVAIGVVVGLSVGYGVSSPATSFSH
jgi:hypothetical protein